MGQWLSAIKQWWSPAAVEGPVNDNTIVEHVHLLSPQDPEDLRDPEFDILFIHGLQLTQGNRAWWDTWTSTATTEQPAGVCWPAAWLGAEYPRARIMSYSYDSYAFANKAKWRSLWDHAQVAFGTLTSSKDVKLGARPFYLVGHSLGGLLAKALVVEACKPAYKAEGTGPAFCKQLLGIIGYGVPNFGAQIATTAQSMLQFSLGIKAPGKNLMELELFGDITRQLDTDFNGAKSKLPRLKLFAFAEGSAMGLPWNKIVVEAHAATTGMTATSSYIAQDANHVEICKPRSIRDARYYRLTQFIDEGLRKREVKVSRGQLELAQEILV